MIGTGIKNVQKRPCSYKVLLQLNEFEEWTEEDVPVEKEEEEEEEKELGVSYADDVCTLFTK